MPRTTADKKRAPRITQLADLVSDAIDGKTVEHRTAALTELLPALGMIGRRVAAHAGLDVPARKPAARVRGERALPFRKPRKR